MFPQTSFTLLNTAWFILPVWNLPQKWKRRHGFIALYFSPHTCYHRNQMTHSIVHSKLESITSFRKQVRENFSNSYIIHNICYQEWSCQADDRKSYFSTNGFLIFFTLNTGYFFKNCHIYIRRQLLLVVTQNLKKVYHPEAEMEMHEFENKEKFQLDLIPVHTCAKFFMGSVKFTRVEQSAK